MEDRLKQNPRRRDHDATDRTHSRALADAPRSRFISSQTRKNPPNGLFADHRDGLSNSPFQCGRGAWKIERIPVY